MKKVTRDRKETSGTTFSLSHLVSQEPMSCCCQFRHRTII